MKHDILYKEAIKNIESGKEEKILEGIKILRESGKPETVINIADLMLSTMSSSVEKSCCNFLNDLKDQKAVPNLINLIKDKTYEKIRQSLVTSCWQCNLSFNEYLSDLVDIAISTDYMTSYEALTVIENNITSVTKEDNIISIGKLKEAVVKNKDDKTDMLKELILIIEKIPIK